MAVQSSAVLGRSDRFVLVIKDNSACSADSALNASLCDAEELSLSC